MSNKTVLSYASPLILAVLIFISIFLDTKLFQIGDMNFAVWVVLSGFSFVCGYFINKSFGWQTGGKLVFAVTIATVIVSLGVIAFFREYFQATQAGAEIFVLFALRNVILGCMAYFGMAIAEVLRQKVKMSGMTEKLNFIEETIKDARKESDLILREAQVKANKIVNEAELNAKNILLKKERIEKELKEFIQIEKELIRKYEET
jgi:vacuolar-type H+-ATPase subunit H